MLKFYTAGESHGQALLAFVSGLPAQLPVDLKFINNELHRRQLGYGRGGRQKIRSEERRVGKEWRNRWPRYKERKNRAEVRICIRIQMTRRLERLGRGSSE